MNNNNSYDFKERIKTIEQKQKELLEIDLPLRKKILFYSKIGFFLAFTGIAVLFIILIIYFLKEIVRFFSFSYIVLFNLLLLSGVLISGSYFGLNAVIYLSNYYSSFSISSETAYKDRHKAYIKAIKGMLYSFPILMLFIILNYIVWWDDVYLYFSFTHNISFDEYVFFSIMEGMFILLLIVFFFDSLKRWNKEAIEEFKTKQEKEE